MTILITGATGLIGTALTKQLLESDHTVHFLTTRKEKIINASNHKGFYWNPTAGEIDFAALKGVDTIVNLAGATIAKRWTSSYKKVILESRTETATLLLNSLKGMDHTVRHFISASGISIYPNSLTAIYDETATEIADNFLAEVVIAWEKAVDQFIGLGIKVAKIRTGVVFDTKEGAFPKLAKPIKMGVPSPVGSGSQWISWIHIDDIVSLYIHVIMNKLDGIYNGVAPDPITNKRLTQLIAKTYKIPMWAPKVPAFILQLFLGEMSQLILEGQQVGANRVIDAAFTYKYPSIESALDHLIVSKK